MCIEDIVLVEAVREDICSRILWVDAGKVTRFVETAPARKLPRIDSALAQKVELLKKEPVLRWPRHPWVRNERMVPRTVVANISQACAKSPEENTASNTEIWGKRNPKLFSRSIFGP